MNLLANSQDYITPSSKHKIDDIYTVWRTRKQAFHDAKTLNFFITKLKNYIAKHVKHLFDKADENLMTNLDVVIVWLWKYQICFL